MAGGTGTNRDHEAAARAHLARTLTGGTGLGLGAGLGARAAAGIAVFVAEEVNRLLAAESRLFKGDGDAVLQVVALNGAGPARAAAHAAKESIENAAKAAEIKPACSAAAHLRAVEAELVVAFALFGVAEDLIGLVELLEALLGVFVVGVQVGMAFLGFFAVRAFDFSLGGILAYAQHLIIIALCQKLTYLLSKHAVYTDRMPRRAFGRGSLPRAGAQRGHGVPDYFTSASASMVPSSLTCGPSPVPAPGWPPSCW